MLIEAITLPKAAAIASHHGLQLQCAGRSADTENRHHEIIVALHLTPLSLAERIRLTQIALYVFSPSNYQAVCEAIGRQAASTILPFSAAEFIKFLGKTEELRDPHDYMFVIRPLLQSLADNGVLDLLGQTGNPLLGQQYYFLKALTKREKEGQLWLARALGAEFLCDQYASVTLQLTGATETRDRHAGTGLVVGPNTILTCAHVLDDMRLDPRQTIQGKDVRVLQTLAHPAIDVGIVRVDEELACLPGLSFLEPTIGEEIYVLGYPRIHYTQTPALLLHRGTVTNPGVTTLDSRRVFLYSAIARPGNSGGPIVSRTGHVIGLVTQDLSDSSSTAPFYAGVSTADIVRAVADLEPSLALPVEDFA
jgi:S1-C subfamily serine protease